MSEFTFRDDRFYLDGEEFTVISGAMHYFRIPAEYYRDRLLKLKECGFNTVETYVCWNLHEPEEGVFEFSGMLDIEKYISAAEELGLYVIVRPGPYICAEWEAGGLPAWLLRYKDMNIRCSDPLFTGKVEAFFAELLPRIRPHLITNGGRVIMMQIENEYGSYGDDKDYLRKIAEIYKANGIDCLLYTSDGANDTMLSGGTLPEYPCVANFGSDPEGNFRKLCDFRPGQPKMCGEYWCGWFDHWYEGHHVREADEVAGLFRDMLRAGASLNFYMFHGGTNFGFMNGANHYDAYEPTVTSYDYNALLSEAGDLTPAYHAVRRVIEEETGRILPPLTVKNTEKKAYGEVKLTGFVPLGDALGDISAPVHTAAPLYMEDIGQSYGYTLYETKVNGPLDENEICFADVSDRARIYINGGFRGYVEKSRHSDTVKISAEKGETVTLAILCENMGRVNYGPRTLDRKGVTGVRFGLRHHFGWDMYPLELNNTEKLRFGETDRYSVPGFFRGFLDIGGEVCDTFVKPAGFGKGVIIVNGVNIGRYFNDAGPQKTLFCPAPFLKKGRNEIIVFETDRCARPSLVFTDTPELDG